LFKIRLMVIHLCTAYFVVYIVHCVQNTLCVVHCDVMYLISSINRTAQDQSSRRKNRLNSINL
jgi:hypothetical protein